MITILTKRFDLLILLALCCLLFTASTKSANAQIGISPAFVDISLDNGRNSGQFIVTNNSDSEERYRVQSIYFDFTKEGALNRLIPDEHSLSSWIIFNPKEFRLAPKTKRIIRFAIVPRGELRPGEYWAAMQLESLDSVIGETKDASGRALQLEITSQILVPIFGQFGKVNYSGTIRSTKFLSSDSKQILETKIWNTGNGRLLITGNYKISDFAGKVVDEGNLGKFYLLPNGERLVKTDIKTDVSKGNYKVKIEYLSPQLEKPLTMETEVKAEAAI